MAMTAEPTDPERAVAPLGLVAGDVDEGAPAEMVLLAGPDPDGPPVGLAPVGLLIPVDRVELSMEA